MATIGDPACRATTPVGSARSLLTRSPARGPGNRKWEADSFIQFARLMRDVRNYGVYPRQPADGDIKIYFAEDKCGLLFLEAHRHLKHLAEITAQAAGPA
jgi:hypothetical protein